MSSACAPASAAPAAPALQRPALAWVGGALRPWDEAVVHASGEAFQRGVSVFEGLRGHRQPDGRLGLLLVDRHFRRMCQSAQLLHIPMPVDADGFRDASVELAAALQAPGKELYARATVLAVEGHWGLGTVSDLVVLAYQQDSAPSAPVDLGVSTWRRSADLSLPARIKTGANYQVGRLARIEGRRQGMDEMILLNEHGRVAEATAACVLMVRDGRLVSPPAWEAALESITLELIERICADLAIPFERRPIERTELEIADEIGLCGTLAEIMPARSIEGRPLDPAWPLLGRVLARYRAAVRGLEPLPGVEVTPVPLPQSSSKESP